ncbi:MAG: acyltransferase [Methylovulum sp.]|nr:acyltransferase [Methylovulum sp.]MCF8007163.1 acyltransferase [Methylovulum sp.]
MKALDRNNQLVFNLKKNSFNFLRLVLASFVLVAHSFELGGFGYDPIYYLSGNVYSIGAIAVDGFFSISGILIIASYKNINSITVFIWHRILRIFPGYWLCIILTSILLPIIFKVNLDVGYALHNSFQPVVSVFQSAFGLLIPLITGWAPNLANIPEKIPLFGQGIIPGVFDEKSVNGSLWSLVHEFRLYCLIAILGVAGLLKKPVLVLLLVVSWGVYSLFLLRDPSWQGLASTSSFRTTAHFLMGSVFYLHTPILRNSWALVALISSVVALVMGYYPIVSPLTTTYLMIYLATVIPLYNFGASNDFSYGLYIYAFPVQKTLTELSLNSYGLLAYFIISMFFSMIFAVLSWYTIEKKALQLKKLTFRYMLSIFTSRLVNIFVSIQRTPPSP